MPENKIKLRACQQEILYMLDQFFHGTATTQELAEKLDLKPQAVSKSLSTLAEKNIVQYSWNVTEGRRWSALVNLEPLYR